MVDQVPPGALVGLVDGRPRAPPLQGVLQAGGDLAGIPGGEGRLPHPPMLKREANRLASHDVEARGSGRPVDPEVGRRGKQQPVGTPAGRQAAGYRFENRLDQAVFGTRSIANLDFQLPVGTGQAAQQYPRRPGTQVVAAVVAANRHGVGQHRGAGRRPERSLQRHGLVHVCAAGSRSRRPAGSAKCPASESRMRANTAGASKRGKHSQSTEPARLTSAAERQSDSRA